MSKALSINIQIQTISECSGIFISDSNVMYGWGSHEKENIGFGSISDNNLVRGNINVVFDSDYMDTIIDDRDTHAFIQHSKPQASANVISFDKINVNSMQQNSGVFVGQSNLNGLDQHQKQNGAYGTTVGGSNVSVGNCNIVYDPDVIDGVINDQDHKPGVFVNG
jgi:hypothetical protein